MAALILVSWLKGGICTMEQTGRKFSSISSVANTRPSEEQKGLMAEKFGQGFGLSTPLPRLAADPEAGSGRRVKWGETMQ